MSGILRFIPKEEYVLPGNPSCPGCPIPIALRYVLKALEGKAILVIPASCSSIVAGPHPKSSFKVPVFHIAFAAAAAAASGISEALEIKGIKDMHVVVWAGDGGTVDIGLQALSGAAERNNNIIYICYDNEAYMNTGIQRSGATPYSAWTTTTVTGKKEHKKNLPLIVAAHGVPYVATATVGYPVDLYNKVKKASKIRGFKYIHILAPCPVGWRFPDSKTIEISKLAVETGMWILYEIENGVLRLTGPSARLLDKSKRKPVEEYLKLQGRFRHITEEDKRRLQEYIDYQWEIIKKELSKKK
ncbi:MAG: pyruvate synthase subunit beta [Candidatus Iainarchaeum archaeon]|uniref:Pyruvate synthase subunit beta n=1 Tax=Candidatus Iainarchaeum sp. TaxID=3101447 RepID=A0A497JJ11_9ARCH|nr:MAG: pyruvate synthase subunit beta [Candidatus Diapherotrites archaeon]HDH07364.1 pyruvate synthase subunit beta [Thermoproteales archaeon]